MQTLKFVIFGLISVFCFVVATLSYRLDDSVIPKAYDITITPYLQAEDGEKQFTFDGDVSITLQVKVPKTKTITLHKCQIDISETALYDNNLALVQEILISSYEAETDRYTLYLNKPLSVNTNYTLLLKFQGKLNDYHEGFFRFKYKYPDGVRRWIGLTKSHRINARKIFPCFDEPALKASFKMHINRHMNYSSIFNTRLTKSEKLAGGRVLDHFETTPPMSTYHVTFVVSDFAPRGTKELLFYTPPFYYYCTDYSYEVSVKTIKAFDDFTLLSHKKLGVNIVQMVASPSLPDNCMESWGLVIYRDFFLVHVTNTSDGWLNKEDTIEMVTHELAHIWFGYAVTFSWWSHMWLNEAFARYFQFFMANTIYPEYYFDQQFVAHELQGIFLVDALNATQPLTSPEEQVKTQLEINGQLSSIAYGKGASILRMIHHCMGTLNFHSSVQAYLKQYHFNNTKPAHLFDVLKKNWPQTPIVNFDEFFWDWTEQVGYPMLIVNITPEAEVSRIHLEQRRFLIDPSDGSDVHLVYTIPLTYTTDTDDPSSFEELMPKKYFPRMTGYTWRHDKVIKWIIFNRQQANYYRVFYDPPLLAHIKEALMAANFSGIPVKNRAQIVDDLFNYAQAGMIPYLEVMNFIEFMAKETEYLPWYAALSGLKHVAQHLSLYHQQKLGRWIEDIVDKVYIKVGFDSPHDTGLDIYTRNIMIDWVCKYRHVGCNRYAQFLMKKVVRTGIKPVPEFRETLYCCAMRGGSFAFYDALRNWYKREALPSEEFLLVRAMGCTRLFYSNHYSMIVTHRSLNLDHKAASMTMMYSENPENVMNIFHLISSDIKLFINGFGKQHAANIVSDLANYFTSRKQLRMLEYFNLDCAHEFGAYESVLHNAVVNVEKNLDWAESHLGPFIKHLEERNVAAAINGFGYASILLLGINYYFIYMFYYVECVSQYIFDQ